MLIVFTIFAKALMTKQRPVLYSSYVRELC